MSDSLTQKKFIRCVGLSVQEEDLLFSHDYGEKSFPWNCISHTFALIHKKKGAPLSSPLFILTAHDDPALYYVDGNIISSKYFSTNIEISEAAALPQAVSRSEQTRTRENDFKKLVREVCMRLPVAHIDKPLVTYLKGSQVFLPTFSNLKEISDYVTKTMSSSSRDQGKGFRELESDDEKLKKVSAHTKQREEWNEGAILEGVYTVQEVLRGGMGTVYIVFDSENVRFYAIKTFQERYLWDERVNSQFFKEAEIWIDLEWHPHIVKAELVKMIEGKPYIFLEYVQGTDLEKLLKKEKLPVKQALELSIQFCEGMHYAFKKVGLIHRDIKPSNCLITREGVLKITDFGLGKIFDEASVDGELVAIPQKGRKKKTSNSSTTMVGTLPFMAPELFTDLKSSGIRTDIYSFGIVIYNMLTGINPFYSDEPAEVISRHVSLAPEDPRSFNEDIPERMVALVNRCIEKSPEERFEDFLQIRIELEEIYLETFGVPYIQPTAQSSFTEDDWLNKGLSLASLNRHREAIITFDQALSMNPGSLRARIYKGFSLLNFGKILESLACIDEGMRIDAENWELWFYKGESHWKLGNLDEALCCFDHALTLTEEQAPILGRKGKLLADMGNLKEALGCYNQALAQNPRAAEIWDAKGDLLITMKHYESAMNCLKEALEINPRSRSGLYHLGVAFFNLGFFKEAIEELNKVLAIDPDKADAWIVIGDCYRELGKGEKALAAYRSARSIEPDSIGSYFSSIELLKENSRWEDALELVDLALEIEQDNTTLFLERAETLIQLGSYEDALSLCQVILDIEPDNEDARHLLQSATRWVQEQEDLLKKIEFYRAADTGKVPSDLNGVLSSFCIIDDALSHMEKNTAASMQEHYTMACLCFIIGRYQEASDHMDRALGDPDILHRAAIIKDLINDRVETRKQHPGKRKPPMDMLFRKSEKNAEILLICGLERLHEGLYHDAREHFREALEIDKTLYSLLYYMGRAYDLEGNQEKARFYYDAFSSHVPCSRGYLKERLSSLNLEPLEKDDIYLRLAGTSTDDCIPWIDYLRFLSQNNYHERLKLLASAIMKSRTRPWMGSPQMPLYWNISGLLQYMLGQFKDAQKSFARALELDGDNSMALLAMGRCFYIREEYEQAQSTYGQLIERGAMAVPATYLQAELLCRRDMAAEALNLVEESLRKEKSSLLLSFKKAQILFMMKRHSDFMNFYSRIYDLDPHFLPVKILRSLILLEAQKNDDAILELTGALNLAPGNLLVGKNLGCLYLQSQNLQKALPVFDRLLSQNALNYEMHMGKGITCYLLKHYSDACHCFQEALNLYPTEPDLWQFLGAVAYHLSDFTLSLKCWDRAIRHRSRFIQAWTNKGVLLYEQKEYIQAQECVDKALRIDPENPFAWLCRAQCMSKLGKMREALKNVENALAHSPHLVKGWAFKGALEFQQRTYELAMQSFDRASQIDTKRAEIWYNKALAALYINNYAEAKKSLDRAIALNHNLMEAHIACFVLSKNANDNAPRHSFLSRAQLINPVRFEEWAQEYQNRRNPLAPLKLMEIPDDPFSLPLIGSYSVIDPLDLFDLLGQTVRPRS